MQLFMSQYNPMSLIFVVDVFVIYKTVAAEFKELSF